jgi:hypothetical protein
VNGDAERRTTLRLGRVKTPTVFFGRARRPPEWRGTDDVKQSARTWALVAIWLTAIVVGFGALAVHENTPGESAAAVTDWPSGTGLRRDPTRLTLILFAHPKCPCTRYSLDELAAIIATDTSGAIAVQVVFWQPAGGDESWRNADTWRKAERIAGAVLVADPDGREARRFGATTSGHTLVFVADGRLLFCGGITGARGHIRANAGRRAVSDLAAGRPAPTRTPVFGCPLYDE